MPRFSLRVAALTALISVWTFTTANAQTPASGAQPAAYNTAGQQPPQRMPYTQARPISQQTPGPGAPHPAAAPGYPAAGFAAAPAPHPYGHAVLPGYPYLNAPLSPTPLPNIPYQVGGAVITNQALSPHEMLYPHKYKALYPPFYHKVRGHWFLTPWGVWSYDHWELQGTEVEVNYRDHFSPLSLFCPPGTKW